MDNVSVIWLRTRVLVIALQQRLWDLVAAGPAGHLSDAVDVENAGLVVLVPPGSQQSRRGAGLSTQGQHSQRRSGRQHFLLQNAVSKSNEQRWCDLRWRKKSTTVLEQCSNVFQ